MEQPHLTVLYVLLHQLPQPGSLVLVPFALALVFAQAHLLPPVAATGCSPKHTVSAT